MGIIIALILLAFATFTVWAIVHGGDTRKK